jgi:plasmid stabilization system protein ParE
VRLELHPEARAELRSAALWYDERRPGLGDEFISEVSAALDRIGDAPESYPPWPRTRVAGPMIRKATIQRFPYVIVFESTRSICSSWRSPTLSAGHSTG